MLYMMVRDLEMANTQRRDHRHAALVGPTTTMGMGMEMMVAQRLIEKGVRWEPVGGLLM